VGNWAVSIKPATAMAISRTSGFARNQPGWPPAGQDPHVGHGPAGAVQPGEAVVNGGSPAMRT